ncbi:hypothetical protein RRG08_006194 [Elysia crispata]|uniref:Uncharacterized protein n=1 Tax=Elysia crispata TaxID=231223 RepID=A0AAE1A3K6_9GAST|nr:hypothetical protein RRG08_006194 [Elysia crispata]
MCLPKLYSIFPGLYQVLIETVRYFLGSIRCFQGLYPKFLCLLEAPKYCNRNSLGSIIAPRRSTRSSWGSIRCSRRLYQILH